MILLGACEVSVRKDIIGALDFERQVSEKLSVVYIVELRDKCRQ
jgi:hypothetical protein